MKAHTVQLPNGYEISDDRGRLDMEFVHRSLEDAYWSIGRAREVTERSWANCLCLGIYAPDSAQVGFARVLTDYAMRAHIGDVFVDPSSRGMGLGGAMMAVVLAHPELGTVTKWTLTTSDAQALYARYGFAVAEADGTWMTLDRLQSVMP